MEESDLMNLYLANLLTEELLKKGYYLTSINLIEEQVDETELDIYKELLGHSSCDIDTLE